MSFQQSRVHARGRRGHEKLTRRPGACEPCRESKTKCDGKLPCSECRNKKRKRPDCKYRERGSSRKEDAELASDSFYADQEPALSQTEEESGDDDEDTTSLGGRPKFTGRFAALNCIEVFCGIWHGNPMSDFGLAVLDLLDEELSGFGQVESGETPRRSLDSASTFSFIEEAEGLSYLSERCREIHAQVTKAQQYLDAGCLQKSWEEYYALLGKAQSECLDQLDGHGMRPSHSTVTEAKCRLWSRIQGLGVWLSFLSGRTLTLPHGVNCPEPEFKKLGRRRLALANGNRNLALEISRILSLSKTEGYKVAGISVDLMDLHPWLESSAKAMRKSLQGDQKLAVAAADLNLRMNFCSMVINCFRAQVLQDTAQTTGHSKPDSQPVESNPVKLRRSDHILDTVTDNTQLAHKHEQILGAARDILNRFDFIYQHAREDLGSQWLLCIAGLCAAAIIGLDADTHSAPSAEDRNLFERACFTFRSLQKTCPSSRICTTACSLLDILQRRLGADFNVEDSFGAEDDTDATVQHASESAQTSFSADPVSFTESYRSPRKRRRISVSSTTEMSWPHAGYPQSTHPDHYQVRPRDAFEHAAMMQHSAASLQHGNYVNAAPLTQYQTPAGSVMYDGNVSLPYTTHGQLQAIQCGVYPPYVPTIVSRYSVHPPETFHPPLDYPPMVYMPSSTIDPMSESAAPMSSPYTLPPSHPLGYQGDLQAQEAGVTNIGLSQYTPVVSSPMNQRRMSLRPDQMSSSAPPSRRSSIARTRPESQNPSACSETPMSSIFSPAGRRPHPLRLEAPGLAGGILTPRDSPIHSAVDAETAHPEDFPIDRRIQASSEMHGDPAQRYEAMGQNGNEHYVLRDYQFAVPTDPGNLAYGMYPNQHNAMHPGQVPFSTTGYTFHPPQQPIPVTSSFNSMDWNY